MLIQSTIDEIETSIKLIAIYIYRESPYNFIGDYPYMLRLQNIQVQLAKPVFTVKSRKYLRISVGTSDNHKGNIVKLTANPAKFNNEQSIEWAQSIAVPVLYNKQFAFQIFDKHQFGYNPEELQTILQGTIIFDNIGESKGTWEIFTSGNQKIGFLSAQIVSKVPSIIQNILKQNNKLTIQSPIPDRTENRIFRIVSMVARTPNSQLKKGYIVVEVGQQVIKTSQIKSRAGELVFIQPKQITLSEQDTDARIKVYNVKGDQQQALIAEGALQLIGPKPTKKVILMKDGFEVGEIYVESRIADKNQLNNSSFVSNSGNKSRLQNESKLSMADDVQQQTTLKPRAAKSIDFTRLEHFGIESSRIIKPSLLDSSMISSTSARRKRTSVVNQNNNIVFPKERRFAIYQDKQNQRITYLRDRSFQFKQPQIDRYYRGASIGYGGKTDFTRGRHNPGVGDYKLPSIWDRY